MFKSVASLMVLTSVTLTYSHAQDESSPLPTLEPITAQNAAQVQELNSPFWQSERDWVRALAFNPDSSQLAAGMWFNSAHLWSLDTGNEIYTPPYNIPICSMMFSPDGSILVLSDFEGSNYLWDIETQSEIISFTSVLYPQNQFNDCKSVSFNSDGSILAYVGIDGKVHLWDTVNKEDKTILQTTDADYVLFDPNGNLLAVALANGTIEIWDLSLLAALATLSGHTDRISSMAFNPDGTLLATGGHDFRIYLWDLENGQAIQSLVSDDHFVEGIAGLAFSPDGKHLLFYGANTVTVWDVAQWKQAAAYPESEHPDAIFNIDGSLIIVGTLAGSVKLWDFRQNTHYLVGSHDSWVNDIAVSSNGLLIASASEDGSVRLWGVPSDE